MLNNPLYAGYYEFPNWEVSWRKGKNKAIISLKTYQAIQKRLLTKERILTKVDNSDFPLRGLVTCKYCGKSMTGSHVKGRSKYYALYTCNTKSCIAKPKNIQKQKLETDYELLLNQFNADKQSLEWFKSILYKRLKYRCGNMLKEVEHLNYQKKQLNKKINVLLDRLIQTTNKCLVETYETKLTHCQQELHQIEEQLTKTHYSEKAVRTAYEKIVPILENPYLHWFSYPIEKKKELHLSMFPSGLTYAQNQGFRTAESSFLFSLKEEFRRDKFYMVDFMKLNWNQVVEDIIQLSLILSWD